MFKKERRNVLVPVFSCDWKACPEVVDPRGEEIAGWLIIQDFKLVMAGVNGTGEGPTLQTGSHLCPRHARQLTSEHLGGSVITNSPTLVQPGKH